MKGKVNVVSMFHFLETDLRKQKNYEMRTQTYVDNTANDLRYEIKYENCVKDKSNFFSKSNIAFLSWAKYILFSEAYFLRYASAIASNAALVKFTD